PCLGRRLLHRDGRARYPRCTRRPVVHGGCARSRPDHPHEWRAAHERLSSLAERAQRVLLHRRLLARVPRARLPARRPRLPAARTPVRALMRTHAQRLASRDGYFPPESMIRRLGNTPLTPMLGGGTAVLLQVAHPLVAAGVAQHSDYHHDLWRRLGRTMRALYLIAFGTKAEADRAGAAVQAVHTHIRGTIPSPL